MKTYIINLERSKDRKKYMEEILKDYPSLDYEFVAAVDGKAMNEAECLARFNAEKFKYRYSREVRPGEIGCTLSHQKCYRKMLDDNETCVLILEDDILKPSTSIESVVSKLEGVLSSEIPQIILLSGWFWFECASQLTPEYKLVNVFDALLTHAYIINKAAAKVLIEEKPYITADDWRYIRRRGVKLRALYPHLVNQNWDGSISSTVDVEKKNKVSFRWYWHNAFRLVYMKLLKIIGHFEKP